MTKIFISYRRKDTEGIAGRIYDRLADKFGPHAVFMDIDSIPEGADFRVLLNEEVSRAGVVLALIGAGWSDARDKAGRRRLDNPDDFVRIELESALKQGKKLVPVLIGGAPMPETEDLPESLRPLTGRHAAFVDMGRDFHPHMNRLMGTLEQYVGVTNGPAKRESAEWSAAEWGRLQNSTNIARLKQFETLAHVYYVEEVRERIEALEAEAEAKRRREEEEARRKEKEAQAKAEEARRKAAEEARRLAEEEEDRRLGIRVSVGTGGERDEVRRIKPGSGESFKDAPFAPEMVVVPAGDFMMGSPDDEPERTTAEGPQHKVIIPRPFAVGRYAVTFDEWDAAVADKEWQRITGVASYTPGDEGWGRGRRPVIDVSWEDAQAYIKWLKAKTGKDYRLLSEAEWEYVCRAGTTTPFWWGKAMTPDQANYDGNYTYGGGGSKGEYRQKTMPVDAFKPNPWGLYQVHGNVWEWCQDHWNDSYNGAPSDGSAWTTGDGGRRVVRGGSWVNDPWYLRSAYRSRVTPVGRYDFRGFRLGRTLTP